jgi:hypothetical protein
MKIILKTCLFVALMTLSLQVWGADCTSSDITINSQAEVDAFQMNYGGGGTCDTVPGTLFVEGDDITDLDGLANLTSVLGSLSIFANPALTNLDGLANLTSVGEALNIQNNAALTNLNGLANLSNFSGVLFINFHPVLTNLDGLENLTSVGFLQISSNPILTNLDGLANLTNAVALTVESNATLTNLDAFAKLTSVSGDLYIYDNAALSSCYGLATILDEIDDAEPGPGTPPIPDVGGSITLEKNLPGCNSVAAALTPPFVAPVPGLGPLAFILLACLMLLAGIVGVRRQSSVLNL